MLKARKKLKATPSKHGKAKAQFITRSEARRRAEQHVINQMFKGAPVKDGSRAVLRMYIPEGRWKAKDTWVVYKNLPATELRSSDIIVVCKRTGRVLYEGSAHDEG